MDSRPQKIIISATPHRTLAGIMENGRYVEFFTEQIGYKSIVGNIYSGIVEEIVPALQAAFVVFGNEQRGFLHINEICDSFNIDGNFKSRSPIKKLLKKNERIIIQVIKDSYGEKLPQLTSKISISSEYTVILPRREHTGFSNKISGETRKEKLETLAKKFGIPGCGYIFRTESDKADDAEISKSIEEINLIWKKIETRSVNCRDYEMLYSGNDFIVSLIKENLNSKFEYEIFTDNQEILNQLQRLCARFGNVKVCFEQNDSENGIYNIFSEFEKCGRNKVWLKCGGHLFIEHTEALVAIDINSGKNVDEQKNDEIIYKTNSEALVEAARQIRLRNIGGLIIIDIMNMLSEESTNSLVRLFIEEMKNDRAKHKVIYSPETGVIQVMRRRSISKVRMLRR